MRTTPVLRTLATALLTGGTLAVAALGTMASAAPSTSAPPTSAPPTLTEGRGGGHPVWGTVTSRTEVNVRSAPTTHSGVVTSLSPGSQDRVQCMVRGQSVNGTSTWYWLVGAQGWASASFVDTGGAWVPTCSDPCRGWKDGGNGSWGNGNWGNGDRGGRGDRNDSWNSGWNDGNWNNGNWNSGWGDRGDNGRGDNGRGDRGDSWNSGWNDSSRNNFGGGTWNASGSWSWFSNSSSNSGSWW